MATILLDFFGCANAVNWIVGARQVGRPEIIGDVAADQFILLGVNLDTTCPGLPPTQVVHSENMSIAELNLFLSGEREYPVDQTFAVSDYVRIDDRADPFGGLGRWRR